MKKKFLISFAMFVIMLSLFVSCKKEVSCEDCNDTNKPPIAIAGPNQVITLPTDSVKLDASASNDPDGTISEWLWKKISGPASFVINSALSEKAIVKNLKTGTYEFELKVTDNGGLSATDTVHIIVDSVLTTNHPPVANAGPDQTIALPDNTIHLDGSGSTDPDNNITAYLWTKISGPMSFTIGSISAVQVQVTDLLKGTYQFELKVTDATGLFSRDTMQIIVNDAPPPSLPLCDNSNRPLVNAQLIPFGNLSKPKYGVTIASAGNKILYAGGKSLGCFNNWCEDWGSTRVDIYDLSSQSWSIAELSTPRFGIASVAAGNKIFFAGGESGDGAFNTVHSNVDIYDALTNTWTVTHLSQPRSYIGAAVVDNKVIFAGGEINDHQTTDRVDIYDLSTGAWSTSQLSEARAGISPVTVDNRTYFAGGHITDYWTYIPSNKIDVYDSNTQSWSVTNFSFLTGNVAAVTKDARIYWARGCDVEIKDVNANTVSGDNLSRPGGWIINDGKNVVLKNDKIIFFKHGWDSSPVEFDIYDIPSGTWSIGVLPQLLTISPSIFSVGNIIYVVGGASSFNYSPSNRVWKLEF